MPFFFSVGIRYLAQIECFGADRLGQTLDIQYLVTVPNGLYEAISCPGGGLFKLQGLKIVFKVNAGYGERVDTKPMLQKPVSVSNDGICPFHNCIVAPSSEDWSKASYTFGSHDIIYVVALRPRLSSSGKNEVPFLPVGLTALLLPDSSTTSRYPGFFDGTSCCEYAAEGGFLDSLVS